MPLSRGSCRLRTLLKNKRLSQAELARRTGYHPRMISYYVNDVKHMSVEVMRNISLVLGCYMEELYEWDDADGSE